jgi:hypothetical protein
MAVTESGQVTEVFAHDIDTWLDCVRDALDIANDYLSEEDWDEVCTAWAWIVETIKDTEEA